MKRKKNIHAVILGRLGGKAGTGAAKARTSEQARNAALSRGKKKTVALIMAILSCALFPVFGQQSNTNALPEPFVWVASSNYTDQVFKNIKGEIIQLSDQSLKGKIVKFKTNSVGLPKKVCEQVAVIRHKDFWLLIAQENISYMDAFDVRKLPRGHPDFSFYIYIPDDELYKQIYTDLDQATKLQYSKTGHPIGIILGTKVKISMGRTIYSW